MNDMFVNAIIRCLINDFKNYQVEWLTGHNDIEFCPKEEKLIVDFLNDTADCFISEHTS